jgi:hypothetical protein
VREPDGAGGVKNFLAGILATVIAGLLLVLGQDWIQREVLQQKPELQYFEFSPSLLISAAEVSKWETSLSDRELIEKDRESLAVTAITIENRGALPVEEQGVLITDRWAKSGEASIVGFKNDVIPGKDGVDTVMKIENGGLRINYKLINPGEIHRFWIITSRFADLDFNIRNPKLNVRGWDSKIYSKEDPTFFSQVNLLAIVVALIFGMFTAWVWTYSFFEKRLKRRGEEMADFLEQTKRIEGTTEE